MDRWSIGATMQSRGFQKGQRVGMPYGSGLRYGTILKIERNPAGQEEALIQFDDSPTPVFILTIKLSLA